MTAVSRPPEQGIGPLGAAGPVPGLRWRQVFPGEPHQLGLLRRWLESLLPPWPARNDAAVVATELGTNAIQHTASGQGGSFTVEITWHPAAVRIAVADSGAPSEPRIIDDPAGENGRGLLLIQGLSIHTGMCGDHRGRLVWADVPWGDAGTPEPVSSTDPHETAIEDGEAALASRFAGVPAWFGRSTLQWWALVCGKLVAASSPEELASLLSRILGNPPSATSVPRNPDPAGAASALAAARGQRTATFVPLFASGHGPVPPRERLDSHPCTNVRERWRGARPWQAAACGAPGFPAIATT